MIFTEGKLHGVWIVDVDKRPDERGFFGRTWDRDEFAARGLASDLVQCSVSFNARRGTLRGMHWQAAPHEEVKLVRCTRGAIYDVLLDMRADSPTFKQWMSVELTQENLRALYVPPGVAHGFQTFSDHTEVYYQMAGTYHPESARGVRWDDPAFAIEWPAMRSRVMSQRDATFPDFELR